MPEVYQVEKKEEGVLVGIDLDKSMIQMSCYHAGIEEPETIGPYVGVDKFTIPLCLYTVNPDKQWFYGETAREYMDAEEGVFIDEVWQGCLLNQEITIGNQVYSYPSLMRIFMIKVLRLAYQTGNVNKIAGITFTVRELDDKTIAILQGIADNLPVSRKNIFFQDYKESFSYFILNQKKELWNREVFLFYYDEQEFLGYQLVVNQKIEPHEVLIEQVLCEEHPRQQHKANASSDNQMDTWFAEKITELFGKRLISTVYLIGSGFDQEWMNSSLRLLCHGRRVFQGKNLFSKGACYAAMELLEWKPRTGFYKGGHALACQVRIPVMVHNQQEYVYAAKGGEPWYMAGIVIECILDTCNEVQMEILSPGRDLQIVSLSLENIPKRPNLGTKLQVTVVFSNNTSGKLIVKDMGLGEFYESSGMAWEKCFSL